MATKSDATVYAEIVTRLQSQNVATLRKAAQGKIKNVKGMKKDSLVHALADWEARYSHDIDVARLDEMAQPETTETAKKATESDGAATETAKKAKTSSKASKAASDHEAAGKAKPAKRSGQKTPCMVCGQRPVNNKTAGRDSTMCWPCYEYAGWENTHVDNGHDGQGQMLDSLAKDVAAALSTEMADCLVCQGNDPAKKPVERRNVDKSGETKFTAAKGKTKAQTFAAFAKDNEWKAKIETLENGHLERVIVTSADGRFIEIQWRDGACLNTGTTITEGGKVRKLRNASAAKKIIASV